MARRGSIAALAVACAMAGACSPGGGKAQDSAPGSAHSETQKKNLANFDDLDFRVYSGQRWNVMTLSHAPDIIVHYPDGSTTTGLDVHIEKLKPQFAFAPDTRIQQHPIKLADGNYPSVVGVMEGTFSKPMDLGNGKTAAPTGKPFRLPMVTIGRWENGVMKEEWLFWDNAAFMRQIGLAP